MKQLVNPGASLSLRKEIRLPTKTSSPPLTPFYISPITNRYYEHTPWNAVVFSSHSPHNVDPPDVTSTPSSATRVDRQSAALLALTNEKEKQEHYLKTKCFAYEALPDWLRSECFALCRPFYENHATTVLTDSLYSRAVKLSNQLSMRAGKFLAVFRSKEKSTPPLPKKLLAGEIGKLGQLPFTQEVFDQLGLSKASNLYDLLKGSKVSVSDYRTPELLEKKISQALLRCKFSFLQVPPVMPPFAPLAETPFAKHATEAYDTIATRIIAFHLVTDIVASHHLSLEQEHVQKIVHEVTDNPFEQLGTSSRLRHLIAYAEHFEQYPTCTSLISRDEALRSFAFHRRPISELNAEETLLHQQQRAQEETKPSPGTASITIFSPPSLPAIRDEHREVILKGVPQNTSESEVVHLQKAARFYDVAPLELEKFLRLHKGDVGATIASIKETYQSQVSLEETEAAETPNKDGAIATPFTFISHRADQGFSKWFNGLSEDEQVRVRDTLKNVARGCTGITKAVKGGHRGLYEVRVMDCQLRIYFRFIPGMRIVLLTGGNKGDSRTRQQHDIDRAARYLEEYDHCKSDTDLSDSIFDPSA